MPTSTEATALLLVDTSVAIALVDHSHHQATRDGLDGKRLGLAGHAAFETYSVLTRLPTPARRGPATVAHLLAVNFPANRYLPERAARRVLAELPELQITGGAVYDALVGAAARHHGSVLCSRDRRAAETYRAIGVEVRLLD